MNQTTQLLNTLKQFLKARGMTYKDLALRMNLSETSIKRLFSQESLTLKRLEALCAAVDLEIYDLVLMAKKKGYQKGIKLTFHQEQALVADERMTFFFYFLVNGWSIEDVITDYDFDQQEAQRHLLALDKLGLIELLPHDRFRVLVSSNIFWNREGPLWKTYRNVFARDLLNHPFDMPNERLEIFPAVLTSDSYRIILRKIDALAAQFNELAEMDSALPLKNRFSVGMFMGFRPWFFSPMARIRRR